jgi:ribose 5-phosphate isomerase RpiB
MKIAVINETSAADKNIDIINALDGRGHEIYNLGMKKSGSPPELTYIHTGLLTGLLLNLKKVDFVVGGCGTGQGYLNSAMQYPGVFCGLMQNPMDAWLFAQINGGNCLSLALNFQYGWAGDVNLKFMFDRLFSFEKLGEGYPEHRKTSQQQSKQTLNEISYLAHKQMHEIIMSIDSSIVKNVLAYPGILEFLDIHDVEDNDLKNILAKFI